MKTKHDQTVVAPLRISSVLAGASLEIVRSPDADRVGTIVPLAPGETTIGRSSEAAVVVRDPGISRIHLKLTISEHGHVHLEDAQSRNGTLLNGVPVLSCALREGDHVQVGATTLRFLRAEPPPIEPAVAAPVPVRLRLREGWLELQLTVEVLALLDFPPGLEPNSWPLLADLVEPGDAESVRTRLAAGGGEGFIQELRVRPRGSKRTWLSLVVEPAPGNARTGTVLDVTARKRAEQELRRLTHTFSALYDGVAILDLDLKVQDWSSSAERLFKIPRARAVGESYPELMGLEGGQAAARGIGAALMHQGRWSQEIRISARLVEAVLAPVTDSEGNPIASIAVHRDLTEQRATQAQLLLANRLSSVGTLAAGVAHEINNPLSFIHANLAYLAERLGADMPHPDSAEWRELAQVISDSRHGVDRIANIVRDLKRLSQPDSGTAMGPVDVVRALRLALRMANKQISPVARLKEELQDVPRVYGNEGRLEQVFLNLLVNAAQAIQPGRANNEISVVCRREGGRRVLVEVRDTGAGIPPDQLDRVFDPFFTTKAPGQGTGLGLSICHSLIQSMGGVITVDSVVGQGTTVRVELAASGEVEQVTDTARMFMGRPARGRLLLVDDEPMVLSSLRRLLEKEHEVACAESWEQVRGLLAQGARFDVIITDVMMPDTSGLEGYRELVASLPEQAERVVFMTGGVYVAGLEQELDATRRPLLAKPVDAGRLSEVIGEQLARAAKANATPPAGPTT